MIDAGLSAIGPVLPGERFDISQDQKIQSNNGYAGVKQSVVAQTGGAVEQAAQNADPRLKKKGEFVLDEKTREVYYRTKDPVTGKVEKIPTEAQMRMAAALKEEIDKKLTVTTDQLQQPENLTVTGQFLDAEA